MKENDISYKIRGAIYDVYNELGSGLFESIYQAALQVELLNRGLDVQREVSIPILYKGKNLDLDFKTDFLVENKVIVEIKSVKEIEAVHHKQLLTYLKLSNLKLGILVNFNVSNINNGIIRKVNGLED